MREKIWYNMIDAKFQAFYLENQTSLYQKYERRLNVILAISSSSSIGAWIVWNKFNIIWAIILALGNVVTAVRPYFPYAKFIKELNEKAKELNYLHHDFEQLWYQFEEGRLTDEQASSIFFRLSKKNLKITSFSDKAPSFEKKEIYERSEEQMKIYSRNNYNVEF